MNSSQISRSLSQRTTLASSSILGLLKDAKLSAQDFNNLGSAFYIGEYLAFFMLSWNLIWSLGYLVFIWPQNWALQKFPVGRWLSFNILIWFVTLHLAISVGLSDCSGTRCL